MRTVFSNNPFLRLDKSIWLSFQKRQISWAIVREIFIIFKAWSWNVQYHFSWYEISRVPSAGIDQKAIFPPHLHAPLTVLLIQPQRQPSLAISIRLLFFRHARECDHRKQQGGAFTPAKGDPALWLLFMVQLKLGPLKNACRTCGRYLAAGGGRTNLGLYIIWAGRVSVIRGGTWLSAALTTPKS